MVDTPQPTVPLLWQEVSQSLVSLNHFSSWFTIGSKLLSLLTVDGASSSWRPLCLAWVGAKAAGEDHDVLGRSPLLLTGRSHRHRGWLMPPGSSPAPHADQRHALLVFGPTPAHSQFILIIYIVYLTGTMPSSLAGPELAISSFSSFSFMGRKQRITSPLSKGET